MMTPYEVAFQKWRERCRFWMHCERGRCAALAKHLMVSRQTVWRWFNNDWSKFPGWAAVAANVWYYEQAREADTLLREEQKQGPLYAVPLRKPKRIVTVQADKPFELVRRSADKPRGLAALEFEFEEAV